MTRTQELSTLITARKEGDRGRGTYGWIFPKNLLAEFDFLSVFTSVSSALLPLLFNSKRSLRSTFAESCSICFTFKHPPSPPLQKGLSHAGYLVPDNNAQLPPEGFGTHSIEPFASLKVRTTSLINILQGKYNDSSLFCMIPLYNPFTRKVTFVLASIWVLMTFYRFLYHLMLWLYDRLSVRVS